MPIPKLTEHGVLPDGIHDCTLQELEEAFGTNRWMQDPNSESRREVLCPQRRQLFEVFSRYVEEFRTSGLVVVLLVDGSFVTDKPDPNDLDLIVVFPLHHDFTAKLPPRTYDLVAKQRLPYRGYRFDVFFVADGSPQYKEAFALFRRVRDRPGLQKGILRVRP